MTGGEYHTYINYLTTMSNRQNKIRRNKIRRNKIRQYAFTVHFLANLQNNFLPLFHLICEKNRENPDEIGILGQPV